MSGVPAPDCDIFTATGALGVRVTAWPWCWRARQRDTAGTAGGRSPGCRARQPPRRRASARRARRKLPHRVGETPENTSRLWPVTPAALLPLIARASWKQRRIPCGRSWPPPAPGRRSRVSTGPGQYRARYGGRYRRLPDPVPPGPSAAARAADTGPGTRRDGPGTGYAPSSVRARMSLCRRPS